MGLRMPAPWRRPAHSANTAVVVVPTVVLPPASCPLLLLPNALFSRVLHFLSTSATHKLNELSHLCHHFTPLPPVAFHHSHLELRNASVASRPRALLVPTAALGVQSFTFDLRLHQSHSETTEAFALLTQLLAPPWSAAASPFSSLRTLNIRLDWSNSGSNHFVLSTLFPSTAAFPYLKRLTVCNSDTTTQVCQSDDRLHCRLSLSALANLRSLRHLTLCLPLSVDDYGDVFSLPTIETINLCNPLLNHELSMPQSVLLALQSVLSTSCRTLRLPRLNNEQCGSPYAPHYYTSVKPTKQLMTSITRQAAAGQGDGLQYLAMAGGGHDHALLLAPAFPSLTALRVDALWVAHDTAAVLPALAGLPFLQHLSVALGPQPVKALWEQFLRRAGSRMKTAHVRDLDKLYSAALAVEWAGMLLEHCTGLESLELAMLQYLEHEQWYNNLSSRTIHALSAPLHSLAQLHTLGLWGLQLAHEQVEAIVQACPLLEDCTLKIPSMSAIMLAVLGRCCPLLRRVWLEGQSEAMFVEAVADSLLAHMQPCGVEQAAASYRGWFHHLRVLYIDWMRGGYHHPPQYMSYVMYAPATAHSPLFDVSPRFTTLLARILANAPIRYLRLPLVYGVSVHAKQLLDWSSRQHMRAIDLVGHYSPAYYHCTEPNPSYRTQHGDEPAGAGAEVWTDSVWWERASDRSMTIEPRMTRMWLRVFKQVSDTAGTVGSSDGRAEFCAELQKEVEFDENTDKLPQPSRSVIKQLQ